MLQFDFISQRPHGLRDMFVFFCLVTVSIIFFVLAPQKPYQKPIKPTKIFSKPQWIDLNLIAHFIELIKRIHSPNLWVKKVQIFPNSIVLSGNVEQQVFYDFWQALKQDSKVAAVDLLHWYEQGQSFHYDVRVSLR